jgi:hypothetical protein
MVQSPARTVAEYLAALPADRREVIASVRRTLLANLDRGFEEGMSYGMISYHVPHRLYPAGYHCNPQQPLPFVALAAQKNHYALYMFGLYFDLDEARQFEREWRAAGKRFDMGKSCVRFKRLDDVPLDVLGKAIQRVKLRAFLGTYEAGLASRGMSPGSTRTAGKVAAKRAAAKSKPASKAKPKTAQSRGRAARSRS